MRRRWRSSFGTTAPGSREALNKQFPIFTHIVALTSRQISAEESQPQTRCAFRNAAPRRFVASLTAFRPAALTIRRISERSGGFSDSHGAR
jgi:hypothetical protein